MKRKEPPSRETGSPAALQLKNNKQQMQMQTQMLNQEIIKWLNQVTKNYEDQNRLIKDISDLLLSHKGNGWQRN